MKLARVSGVALMAALGLSFVAGAKAQAPAKHPITFDDMIKLHRVSAPAISRGRQVGGVCGVHAGHGSEPQREQYLDYSARRAAKRSR